MIYKLMEAAEGKCTKLAGVYLVALVGAGTTERTKGWHAACPSTSAG